MVPKNVAGGAGCGHSVEGRFDLTGPATYNPRLFCGPLAPSWSYQPCMP